MYIEHYKQLIINLPVGQQNSITKRKVWGAFENNNNWFKLLMHEHFGNTNIIQINRKDVFNSISIRELILKTILWGYTKGMRGSNFNKILANFSKIEDTLDETNSVKDLDSKSFNRVISELSKIEGLGISTYSKLLYFHKVQCNSSPCLILDTKIIKVLRSMAFTELSSLNKISYSNANSHYLQYIESLKKIADHLETQSENIEEFLFIFGANLKM